MFIYLLAPQLNTPIDPGPFSELYSMSTAPRSLLARERADWEAAFANLSVLNHSLFFSNFGGFFDFSGSDPPYLDLPIDKICEELASDLFTEFESVFVAESDAVEFLSFD
jgi:hypothetical protein